jgi:fibronectin type 3 domain-containing protein
MDLKASQNQTEVILAWTNPQKYVDGSNATDLMNVHILQNGKSVVSIPVLGPGMQQTHTLNAASGTNPVFTLEVETQRGKMSAVSNEARVSVVDVPGVVLNLKGVMDQHRIRLDWDPPIQNPSFAEVYIIRREDGAFPPVAVTETHWEDMTVEAGKTYGYIVAAARSRVPPVSGRPSPLVSIPAIDKVPPAAPTGLQPPVVSDSGANLHWDPNTEDDRAGYNVYRSDNPDRPLNNALLTITSFTDGAYRPGSSYRVTAVDDSGNESEKSPPVRAP